MNLIGSKEAKLAWANGEELEFFSPDLNLWFGLNDEPFMSDVFETRQIRLKPKTIKIELEIPICGSEYKFGSSMYVLNSLDPKEYSCVILDESDEIPPYWWRTEEEVKQVVDQLRKIKANKRLEVG